MPALSHSSSESSSFLPLQFRPFQRVLIANRGEVALRVARACRDLQLTPLAVFSEADIHSRHVGFCDGAVCIGPSPSKESYLQIPNLIKAAKELNAQAVHPGFGFLSESAEFAQAVLAAGLVWIGPSPASIHSMGEKTLAKQKVLAAGVPCSPGKNEPIESVQELMEIAQKVGFPLILKAVSGGGGKGMKVVRQMQDISSAFESCSREALSYFGSAAVFCEKYIERPRHIEIQILADSQGNTVHLFERDCTIQRRHQKLLEESPSSYISEATRAKMGEVAVKAAQAVGYTNAGTVEFILESPTQFYFMEMNTRIQVEHPVTELVTGVDLVQWQLKIAQGQPLAFKQEQLLQRGWAIEARVNAEDPYSGFRPDPGLITHVELPHGPGVRVDSHIYSGYKIPEFYDSMIAKVIVLGQDRMDAMQKLRRALAEFLIQGVNTTIPYTLALLHHPQVREGVYTTRFVEENESLLKDFQSVSNWSSQFGTFSAWEPHLDTTETSGGVPLLAVAAAMAVYGPSLPSSPAGHAVPLDSSPMVPSLWQQAGKQEGM